MIRCKITLSDENIYKIYKAIDLDNGNYVNCKIEDNKMICEMKSDNLNSFMRTLDDLLEAISLSSKIINEKDF